MVGPFRLGEVPHVIEDNRHRQPFQHILELDDAFALRNELNVPAELSDLSRDRVHIFHWRATREPRSKTDAAHALVVKFLQLVRLHRSVQHYHAPRITAECFQSRNKQAIVSAVGRWLDYDVATQTKAPLQLTVILHARIRGLQRRRRRGGKARVVDMMVTVGRAGAP